MSKEKIREDKKSKVVRHEKKEKTKRHSQDAGGDTSGLINLQQQVGNRAVQRLIAQRKSQEPYELDEGIANRIKRERGGGQPLDSSVQKQMGAATGQDFSGVRVHTSPEANALSSQIDAKAFTTGEDIFFGEGSYNPQSSGGQELIAHELTHVVQQSSGAVDSSGGGMTVNAPGDTFEQEADSVASTVLSSEPEEEVQRQPLEEEEEMLQPKSIQRQEEIPEEPI